MAKHSYVYTCLSILGSWCKSKIDILKRISNKKIVMISYIGITVTVFLLLIYINTNQLSEHYQIKVSKQLKPPSQIKYDLYDQQVFTLSTTEQSPSILSLRLETSAAASYTTLSLSNRTTSTTSTYLKENENTTQQEQQTKIERADSKTKLNTTQDEKQIKNTSKDSNTLPNNTEAVQQRETLPAESNALKNNTKTDQQNMVMHVDLNQFSYYTQTDKQNITTITNKKVHKQLNIPYSTEARTCPNNYQQSHFMRLSPNGRTGNVMFQIITLLATARSYCYTPLIGSFENELGLVLDLNFTDVLNINQTHAFKSFGYWHCSFTDKITQLDSNYNWSMGGYFQSYMFFNHYEKDIKTMIQFRTNITTSVNDFVVSNDLHKDMLIGVHVRRGDFTSEYNKGIGYTEAPAEYIIKSMKYFNNKYKQHDINFVFLSDDITWCKQNFNESRRVYFSPFGSSPYKLSAGQDLALIRMCNHSIITSGSFGWIGAWLSGGDVIYYDGFPRPGTWLASQVNLTEYYMPHWIGMNENTTITV